MRTVRAEQGSVRLEGVTDDGLDDLGHPEVPWAVTLLGDDAAALSADLSRPHRGMRLYPCAGWLGDPVGTGSQRIAEIGLWWDEDGAAVLVLTVPALGTLLPRCGGTTLTALDAARLAFPLLLAAVRPD